MAPITRLLVAAVALALGFPVAAAADDQAIYNAFHSSHPRFKELRRDFEKGEQHWVDSSYRDPGPAYRACRKTASLAQKVSDAIRKKSSSSAKGEEARDNVMRALNHRRRWADAERGAIEAFMRFDGDGYSRRREKARKYIARAQRYEEKATKLFKQAGVDLNP
jgi:hypothetical protein